MYIDTHLRAAKLPARTPEPRFTARPLASSLLVHGAIAIALFVLAQRVMLPAPLATPPIPMVFLPPEPARPPRPPEQAEPVRPLPEPPPLPAPEPKVAQPPPAPVWQAAPRPRPVVKEVHRPKPPRGEPLPARAVVHPRSVPSEPEPAAEAAPAQPPPPAAAPGRPIAPPPAEAGPLIPPRPLSAAAGNRPPYYPDAAKERGEQGRVLLRVDVTADGRASAVVVLRSSGFGRLDESAVAAVRAWRFIPATRGGRAVAGIAEVPVNFALASD